MTLRKKVLKLSVTTILISALICCGKYYVKSTQEIDTFHFKSATELTGASRRGEITSLDLLNLYLDRKPVRVPARLANDLKALHRLVPADQILDHARDHMVNAGRTIRCRWAFDKNIRGFSLRGFLYLFFYFIFFPKVKNGLFLRGKIRSSR